LKPRSGTGLPWSSTIDVEVVLRRAGYGIGAPVAAGIDGVTVGAVVAAGIDGVTVDAVAAAIVVALDWTSVVGGAVAGAGGEVVTGSGSGADTVLDVAAGGATAEGVAACLRVRTACAR